MRASAAQDISNAQVRTQVDQFRNRFDSAFVILQQNSLQGLIPYHIVGSHHITRQVQEQILTALQANNWVNLFGIVGSGKTEMAATILQHYKNQFWIDLRDIASEDTPGIVLREFCAHFGLNYTQTTVCTDFTGKFPEDALIVLDDLPRIQSSRVSQQFFRSLQVFLKSSGVKLLTASNDEVIPRLGFLPDLNGIADCKLNLFKEDEIIALATHFGCNDEHVGVFSSIISSLSEGQPMIVNALCRYFQKYSWVLKNINADALVAGSYDEVLEQQMYDIITSDVTDTDSRTLLYRLKLIIGMFNDAQIDLVCEAAPEIVFPHEKVTGLSGRWIARQKNNSYTLSPLVGKLVGDNVPPALRIEINEALGRQIIRNKMISSFEAHKAVLYFDRSARVDLAGFVLSLALQSANDNPDSFPDMPFMLFWTQGSIPSGVDLHMQAVIRTLQISLVKKRSDWSQEFYLDFLISDLKLIIEKSTQNSLNVSFPALFLAMHYSQSDLLASNEYLILVLQHYQHTGDSNLNTLLATAKFSVESLLWENLTLVTSMQQFNAWLTTFDSLTAGQKEKSLAGDMHIVCSHMFCKTLYERELTSGSPDWESFLTFLKAITEASTVNELLTLRAYCLKTEILVLIKHLRNAATATVIAGTYLQNPGLQDTERFIVANEVGQQLFYADNRAISMTFLQIAADCQVPKYFTEKAEVYLILNQLYGDVDKRRAHTYAEQAYQFHLGNSFVDEIYSYKIIGEYAVSIWDIDKSTTTFYIIEEGMKRILSSYKATDEFKAMVVRYSHVVNYYYYKLNNRTLPPAQGEEYTAPFRGIFLRSNEQLLSGGFYFEQRKFMAANLMENIFESLEDQKSASYWFEECRRLNKDDEDNKFAILMLGMQTHLILENRFEDAAYLVLQLFEQNERYISRYRSGDLQSYDDMAQTLSNLGSLVPDDSDEILNCFVTLLSAINLLREYLHSDSLETMHQCIQEYEKIRVCFKDQTQFVDLRDIFALFSDPSKGYRDLIGLVESEPDSFKKIITYWFASLRGTAVEAYMAQIATLRTFLSFIRPTSSKAPLYFLITPFFMEFWEKKFQSHNAEFSFKTHFIEKGWPLVKSTKVEVRVTRLFQIVAHHLNVEFNEDMLG